MQSLTSSIPITRAVPFARRSNWRRVERFWFWHDTVAVIDRLNRRKGVGSRQPICPVAIADAVDGRLHRCAMSGEGSLPQQPMSPLQRDLGLGAIKIERSRYRGGRGEFARFASCLREFGRWNTPLDRRFSDGRDQPSAIFRAFSRSSRVEEVRAYQVHLISKHILGIAQSDRLRAALFLRGDARLRQDSGADRLFSRAAQAPLSAERRRSGPFCRNRLELCGQRRCRWLHL